MRKIALVDSNTFSGRANLGLLVLCLWLIPGISKTEAASINVLAPFQFGDALGQFPSGALAVGPDGNFYGATTSGAGSNHGAVFKVTSAGTLSKVLDFDATVINPFALVFGPDGNLFGTSSSGSVNFSFGSVFKVTLSGSGNSLSSFASNGTSPHAPLVLGNDGTLYGTTQGSGTNGTGTVFRMTTSGQLTRVASFPDGFVHPNAGASPDTALVEGSPGEFYGTTPNGDNNRGTIFRVTGSSLTLVHTFTAWDGNGFNTDGSTPNELIKGSDGNLYGTTQEGGAFGHGTVFKVTTAGSFTTLVSFDNMEAGKPVAGLVQANDGNFYGIATTGGSTNSGGLFRITPSGTLTVLAPRPAEVAAPSKLIQATDGKLYGTGYAAGMNNAGCVMVVDAGLPPLTSSSVLGNISTRLRVLGGDNALIGGMIATGTANKKVIIRAIGPSLTGFGVPGALANPTLDLFQGSTLLFSNDDWNNSTQQAEIAASGLAPGNSAEAAIIWSLMPGQNYTAVMRGVNNTTGVGVVEAYDLDQAAAAKLGNISTRGFVDVDDNVMIAGLIVTAGSGASTKVLVRSLGPTLGDFGVTGFLANPTLDLVNSSGTVIRSNDNWKDDSSQRALIEAAGLAPSHDEEAALVETVAPGAYTAVVRGSNRTIGVGLVEVYNIQ